MSVDMDKLFQEFNDYADNSKQFLQKMLAVISEGKVPEQKSVDELEDSIENLRKRYASVYKAALAQLPEGDMPEEGMPAAEYVEAVRRNETLQYKKKLEMIRGCLEKFISVRALIERYTFALMPFQEQAEELMKKLDTDIDLESISKKILGPESFLKAIACDNFDSEENYGLLEGVGDYFTPQVMLGVATQNYYIDAGENDRSLEKFKTISMEQQEAESIEECAVTLEAECRIESEECRIKSETEIEAESISKPVSEPVSPPQSDALQESKFVSILRRNEAFLESDKLIGLFSYDISPYEEKRVTSSVFINDMRKGNEIVEKLIIREIIRKSYITGVLGTPEYFTSPTLSYLFQKGYLRKYKMLPDSEFYCASSRLKKALAHKEGSKFIGVRQKAVEEWGTPIEDKETSIATRMSYVKLHEEYGKWFLERGVDVCDRKTSTMTDAFWEEYFGFKDRNEEILLIGAFWSTTEECDEFVNMAEARLAELKEIDIVIFAGINADKAKAVADSLLEMFDIGSKSKALYLYSLSDGGFYDYPHKEKVDKTDIFKSQDKDTKVSEPVMSTEENEKSQPAEDCFENTKKSELSVYENILKMAAAKRFYAATAYAKSCAASNPDIETLYVQLAYAVNDPMGQCNYSTDNAFDLISKHSFFEDALTVSTAIRVFFSNQVRYDYNIKPFYNGIKDYAILNKFPTLGKIVYSLMEFKDTQKKGMDVYAGYCAKSQSELEQEIVKLRQEASVFYDNFVRGKKEGDGEIKAIPGNEKTDFFRKQ